MMVELFFVACLTSVPETCRDESLLYVEVPLMLCVLQGQAQLAAWVERNPDWKVERWSCGPHDPTRLEA